MVTVEASNLATDKSSQHHVDTSEIAEKIDVRPILRVLVIVLVLITGIVSWTVAKDHYAPGT
ncbi:hypothetical protein [Yoonia maritima]|uniref:hypothetical protein n=1 Tax=Yoonia maritima TaxID=1435347 RepID=UPI000D1112B3|nr:hypothetical protein [Yoonia maritima]